MRSGSESESDDDQTDTSPNNKPKEKKRPGRPKKRPAKVIIARLGIVQEPSNLTVSNPGMLNIFEIVYDNPLMFKKIFALFKAMSVEIIRMKLEPEYVKLYAVDHIGANEIYIRVNGKKMNRYYASKPLEFGLNPNNVQKILQTLNKDNSKIYLYTQAQHERTKIKIGLSNDEIEEESIYTVDQEPLEFYAWAVESALELEPQYSLKFDLPFRYFKKKVTDFKLLGDVMKIEKCGTGNLRLSYNFTNKKGDQNTFYKNATKINLKSDVADDEIFSTSVYLDDVKPLAGSLISDSIRIAACIDKKIIFTMYLDQDEKPSKEKISGTERCEIKVLTRIVETRKT